MTRVRSCIRDRGHAEERVFAGEISTLPARYGDRCTVGHLCMSIHMHVGTMCSFADTYECSVAACLFKTHLVIKCIHVDMCTSVHKHTHESARVYTTMNTRMLTRL